MASISINHKDINYINIHNVPLEDSIWGKAEDEHILETAGRKVKTGQLFIGKCTIELFSDYIPEDDS